MTPPCFLQLSDEDYFADRVGDRPCLSSSIAKILCAQSPAHAHAIHPRLGGHVRPPTDEMELGTILHSMLLGSGAELAVVEFDDYKKKAAQETRDVARAEGKIPMLARKVERINLMLTAYNRQLDRMEITFSGKSELAAVWEEPSSCGPVLCKGKLDHFLPAQGLIYDLKTCASAHPDAISRSACNYGYHLQQAAYTRAVEAIRPDLAGQVEMVFLFAETEYPFPLTVARADSALREIGERKWEAAVETWARCLDRGVDRKHWPAYSEDVVTMRAPSWELRANGIDEEDFSE